jgi:tetratricopeptide (TPR) repeat protein
MNDLSVREAPESDADAARGRPVSASGCDLTRTTDTSSPRPRHAVRLTIVMALLSAAASGSAAGQARVHAQESLGRVEFPVSCSAPARAEFERAMALLHHMTYPQARLAFERAATVDPRCAMAHWGIAMTLFQPLWPTRPNVDERRRGWEAAERARALTPPTERERLYVAAAAAFFAEPEAEDYWARIRRWSAAMARVAQAYPDDPEAAALRALALLAVAPADTSQRRNAERAAELLLRVYARNPEHPGAMHYLVHANDAPGRERSSMTITRKYETTAPRNPHALHMPTHIYTRLGDWSAVVRGNLAAADAALEHPAGDRGQYVWDEFPHALEYLVYAYLQEGADDAAAVQLARMRSTGRLEPTFKTAFHLASTAARYALERRAWQEAMALVPRDPPDLPWDRFAWAEAVTWFAKGLSAAREGQLEQARAASTRLDALEAAARGAGEDLFARTIRVLALEADAWIAHAQGDGESSVRTMRQAVELELSTPKHAVTPGPTLPAYELLGDLFMEQDRPVDALDAYRRSLELYPGRFNGLVGAARAARASGDEAQARAYYRALMEVAGGGRRAALDEARTFLAR